MADDGMEPHDVRIEAEGRMVGLAVNGHAAASLDNDQRKQETRYEQAARLARVVPKVNRDHKRPILLAQCRVPRMVQVAKEGPRRRKDNCGSGGRRTRRMHMS